MRNILYSTLEKARDKAECRTCTIKGVKNLSRSDLDAIELYAETIDRTGSHNGLMTPRGGVAEVLKKFGYKIEESRMGF